MFDFIKLSPILDKEKALKIIKNISEVFMVVGLVLVFFVFSYNKEKLFEGSLLQSINFLVFISGIFYFLFGFLLRKHQNVKLTIFFTIGSILFIIWGLLLGLMHFVHIIFFITSIRAYQATKKLE